MRRTRLLLTSLMLSVVGLYADPLAVQGSSGGTFLPGGSSVAGLSFSGSSFGPSTGGSVSLGTFNLSGGNCIFCAPTNYNPYDFQLTLNFSSPAGVGSSQMMANVTGSVWTIFSNVTIDFANTPIHFAGSSGSFDLTLSDVVVAPFVGSQTLMGTISNLSSAGSSATVAAAPEPASIVFMGTLLAGVTVLLRKRLS